MFTSVSSKAISQRIYTRASLLSVESGGRKMVRYIIIRFLWMCVILMIVGTIAFYGARIAHMVIWGQRMPLFDLLPIVREQFLVYLERIVTEWNWGYVGSPASPESIIETMRNAVPYTLRINLIAMGIAIGLALFFGVTSAWKKNTVYDYAVNTFCLVFSSIPSYVWILGAMIVFGIWYKWLPVIFPLHSGAPWHFYVRGYFLPVLAMIGMPLAVLTQMIRGEITEQYNADFLLLAKVKGLRKDQIVIRHLIRNSILPALEKIPALFTTVMFNGFIVEAIYNVPGVARFFIRNVHSAGGHGSRDYAYFVIDAQVVVIVTLFYAVLALMMTLVVDILYAVIDPRITIVGGKKQ